MINFSTSRKHVREIYTFIYIYRKTSVGRGKPNFLILDPKHALWVLVRTASARRF